MKLVHTTRGGKTQKYLLRGDSEGFINMWAVPDISLDEIMALQTAVAPPRGKTLSKPLNQFIIKFSF